MNLPESLRSELAAWNNGSGIDIEAWISCEGNYSLAVGYSSVFWPEFVLFDRYILRDSFSEESLRAFEKQEGADRKSIERLMNHLHISDIQYYGCRDASKDKFKLLGEVLKQVYEAKLLWRFRDRPCTVELYIPDDDEDLMGYALSFWQTSHE